jgi:hypothetical protein
MSNLLAARRSNRRNFKLNPSAVALHRIGMTIAASLPTKLEPSRGKPLSNIHTEAITSRQWRIKIGTALVTGLLLLVTLCAISAHLISAIGARAC